MRKASVHPGSGLSEERSATALPHADPRRASEPATNMHARRYADIQTHSTCAYTRSCNSLRQTDANTDIYYTRGNSNHLLEALCQLEFNFRGWKINKELSGVQKGTSTCNVKSYIAVCCLLFYFF